MEVNKITIVLTTFNRAHFVIEMLQSVKNQTYINWECFIVDDNSTDDTIDVINEFIGEDSRFTLIIKPKTELKGLPASRNIGINKSTGNYLVFFDDDDVIHPQLLELCVKEFNQKPKIDFVNYKKESFQNKFDYRKLKTTLNINSKKIGSNLYEDVILGTLALASCTVLWKTEMIKANLFKETLMYAEEWECYSRILIKNDLVGVKINTPLYFNRKHLSSNTAEFWNNDPVRIHSKKEACKSIIKVLIERNKLTDKLLNFFIQKSYHFKDKSIVNLILNLSWNYKIKYYLFPIKYSIYKLLKK